MSNAAELTPDYSYLSRFRECPRKHFYSAELGIESPEKVPVLKAGTAIHEGLDALHASEDWDVDSAIQAMAESWGDYSVPRTHKHSFLTPGHMEIILRNYADHYRNRPRETYAVGSELFSERSFSVDWDGVTVGGRIDLLEQTADGDLYLVDHKCTTSWLNKWWAQKKGFDIGHQLRLYTAAIERELDTNLAGAYVSGVYMGEKAADPPEKWENRKSSQFRLFGPFSFSAEKLKETRAWIEQGLMDMAWHRSQESEHERREYAWPQNTANRFGCSACDFFELCSSSPASRDGRIKAHFVEKELTGNLASGADSDE